MSQNSREIQAKKPGKKVEHVHKKQRKKHLEIGKLTESNCGWKDQNLDSKQQHVLTYGDGQVHWPAAVHVHLMVTRIYVMIW